MMPHYEIGSAVRVTRNVRNDGTFPGMPTGELLIRRGSVGYVRDVGTFLQDQVIYTVHFLDDDIVVGCREEELLSRDEPWTPSAFEAREKVTVRAPLQLSSLSVEPGDVGEVLKVLRDLPGGVVYHVRFPGHTLQIPEALLETVAEAKEAS